MGWKNNTYACNTPKHSTIFVSSTRGWRGASLREQPNSRVRIASWLANSPNGSRSKSGFAKPEVWNVEIPFADASNGHAVLMQSFVDSILDGTPLIASGYDGMGSVELANVLLYSSLIGQTVQLPLDSAAWETKLNELIANSTKQKKVVKIQSDDFTSSFRK